MVRGVSCSLIYNHIYDFNLGWWGNTSNQRLYWRNRSERDHFRWSIHFPRSRMFGCLCKCTNDPSKQWVVLWGSGLWFDDTTSLRLEGWKRAIDWPSERENQCIGNLGTNNPSWDSWGEYRPWLGSWETEIWRGKGIGCSSEEMKQMTYLNKVIWL